jgi:hypothetical protein
LGAFYPKDGVTLGRSNLQMGPINYCVCSWQAFTAYCNITL